MKRCYIAGAVTGTTDFKDRFYLAQWEVARLHMIPVNPLDLPHKHDKSWQSYMKECIAALMKCDCIFLLEGWEKSKGANIELEIAASLQYPVYHQ